MIQNARVLRDDFVPGDVVHRSAELDTISAALDPVTQGLPGDPILVTGPSGVGKTCLAKYLLRQMEREQLRVRTTAINCWTTSNGFDVLYRLASETDAATALDRQATSEGQLLDDLRTHESPIVVVLDEVDQLDDLDVLYSIDAIEGVTPVLIANREESLFERFDQRLQSRFRGARRCHFDLYSDSELVSILQPRVDEGLRRRSVESGTLEYIADEAAGDARTAITLLRTAAVEASQEDRMIDVEVVESVVPEAREERRKRDLSKLSRHQRHVYEALSELGGEQSIGEIAEAYGDRVEDPKSRKTIRRYLRKMGDYNLVEISGQKRGRRYEAI